MGPIPTEILLGHIQAATAGPVTEEHVPVLLWAYSGTAVVEAAGAAYRLFPNDAIWIPPGVAHCTRTDDAGVVLPIFPRRPELQGPLSEVRVITIPPDWADWLVYQFDFNSYHSSASDEHARELIDLVSAYPAPNQRRHVGAGVPLPLPHSQEGRAVAQTLLRFPGTPHTVDMFAARENISTRTLQRQFRDETGMVFSQWRTRVRVAAAARHLIDGREVGWTGRQVGYATPAGFTRAFRRHLKTTPSEYVHRSLADRSSEETPDDVSALIDAELRQPPRVPARHVWSWVYDWHVLWWAYRGHVTLQIGTREFALRQGDVVWLPAGLSASVYLAEGAILLPLCNRSGGAPISVDDLKVFSLPESAEDYLLHTILAEYTLFRPESPDSQLSDRLFREQFIESRAPGSGGELTGAVSAIVHELRRNPADSRSLAEWARYLHLSPRQVGREFLTQTGTSFPRWRSHVRMSLARELLMFEDPPHKVAKFLGYATPGAFGTVFTAAHGISPRGYQRQVSKQPN